MNTSAVKALARPILAATALLAAGGLAGCVSLFPKTPPVQLYSIGRLPPTDTGQGLATEREPVGVVLSGVELRQAAMGDMILTVSGAETAYIAGARWTTPAALMLQEDAERAFAVRGQGVRLLHRGEIGAASALLRLDFGDFEARYDTPGGAPSVLVSVDAALQSTAGRSLVTKTFTVREPASADRIGPIVAAFDKATVEALAQVVDWTDAEAPSLAEPPATASTVTSTTSTTSTPSTSQQ